MNAARKYWHIFNLGVQNTLVYRVNFFFRALFNLFPLVAVIYMWQAIYAGKTGSIGGYTLREMVSYYILVSVVEAFTVVTEDEWQIASDIKDGNISQFLIKPMDYLKYRLCLFFSGRVIYTAAALAPVTGLILWQIDSLVFPENGFLAVAFVVSIGLTALLQFLLSYCIALLAFWVLEISTFVFILLALERVASGQMFPIDILPETMQLLLFWTPFPYQIFLPISIYMGRLSEGAVLWGIAAQLGWVIACYYAAGFVWRRGVRNYEAVGG